MKPISRLHQLTGQFTLFYLPELGRIKFHILYAVLNTVRAYLYKTIHAKCLF